ncbi:hypothetical protein EVJ58_g1833 [Rhodofomes roseus]|uniref:Uncharacterized protein n=1 Tax=Rhodofomes roseus TaxID=34475 RepID=A0A4Y9YXJ3_9APHY|nr:hypothetical protein EVJ58_g1833 [Rhodofomes roseus]
MTWTTTPSTPGLVYLGVALGYNLILPAIMVIRIYRVSRELRGFWKSTEPRNVYGFVISVMFEATAFYAAVAIITIVTIAIDTSMRAALLPLLGQMQSNSGTLRKIPFGKRCPPVFSSMYKMLWRRPLYT